MCLYDQFNNAIVAIMSFLWQLELNHKFVQSQNTFDSEDATVDLFKTNNSIDAYFISIFKVMFS